MQELINILRSDKCIIITNNEIKKSILEYLSLNRCLLNVAFKTENDVISDIIGEYDKQAMIEMILEKKISSELANIKLNNSLLVGTNKKINKKINELISIACKYNKYLKYNQFFADYYKNKKIITINCNNSNDLFNIAIKKISTYSSIINYCINNNTYNLEIPTYNFTNVKDEIAFVAKQIAILLKKGVEAKNIVINKPEGYYNSIIREIFGLYSIDISLDYEVNLYSYALSKRLINLIDNNQHLSIEQLCNLFNEETKNENSDIVNNILSVLYKYIRYDYNIGLLKEIIVYDLKNTIYHNTSKENTICFKNINNIFCTKELYVFLIGFNQDVLPKICKDEDYLLDIEREELGIITSKEKNFYNRERLRNIINSLNNITISYSNVSFNGELIESSFLSELNIKKCIFKDDITKTYSLDISYLEYAKMAEQFDKFGTTNEELEIYQNNYSSIYEKRYDNVFTRIDKEILRKRLEQNLVLSYTSITKYYECPFSFYLEYILKIKKDINRENIILGNLFHHVLNLLLSQRLNGEIDDVGLKIDEYIKDFYVVNNMEITKKEELFNTIYLDDLKKLYLNILEFESNSTFVTTKLEEEFHKDIYFVFEKEDKTIRLVGKIDKVLETRINDLLYAIVIDYKTGSQEFTWDEVIYGLNMQLLFYFYFLNTVNEYHFGGAYLQSVIPNTRFGKVKNKTEDELYKNEFGLFGYSNEELNVIQNIDCTFGESKLLSKIKIKNDGNLDANSQKFAISNTQYNKLLTILEAKIQEAIDEIFKGNFPIEPKKIVNDKQKEDVVCKFCIYDEICFKKENDYIKVKKVSLKETLEGVKNE